MQEGRSVRPLMVCRYFSKPQWPPCLLQLGTGWSMLANFPVHNRFSHIFSSLSMVASLDCDSHSQAGSTSVAPPTKRPFQQIFSVLLSSRFSSQSFSISCQAGSTMFSCKRVEEEIRSGGRCWLGHLWLDCYPGKHRGVMRPRPNC